MTVYAGSFAVSWTSEKDTGVRLLQREQELNRFFSDVEKRALRIAEIALRNRDDALDIVQDAMLKLVRNYAHKDSAEWAPLFYRILQNGVRDHLRRKIVRNKIMVWFGGASNEENDYDPIAAAPDPRGRTPEEHLQTGEAMQQLEIAVAALPGRQREAFMLRTFEGLNIAATAVAMGVSSGSVKTHYFRAVHALRDSLGEHWS